MVTTLLPVEAVSEPDAVQYCPHCGRLVPAEVSSCPLCGGALFADPSSIQERTSVKDLLSTYGRWIRITLFLLSATLFFTAFFLGSQASLTHSEATILIDQLGAMFASVTPFTIARNNLSICVLLLLPIVGLGLLIIVSYNTELALAVLATVEEVPSLTLFLALLSNPVTWIEAIAYGLAASQGVRCLLGYLSNRLRVELGNLLKVVLALSLLVVFETLWEASMLLP